MVPHGIGGLLRVQVHLALGGLEGDPELVEEVASQQSVADAGAGQFVGSDRHAAHARFTHLE